MAKTNNYGDFGLPYASMVAAFTNGQKRGVTALVFPNSNLNKSNMYVNVPVNHHSFGKNNLWYAHCHLDTPIKTATGGYANLNSGQGPYFAVGLGNYPQSMYRKLNYGTESPKTKKVADKKSPKTKKVADKKVADKKKKR